MYLVASEDSEIVFVSEICGTKNILDSFALSKYTLLPLSVWFETFQEACSAVFEATSDSTVFLPSHSFSSFSVHRRKMYFVWGLESTISV